MSWPRLLLVAALLGAAYYLKPRLLGSSVANVSYVDLEGQAHALGAGKAAAVGFWFEECPQSEAVIAVLNQLRERYPEDKLDVLSFYLNDKDEATVSGLARSEYVRVPVILAQRTPERFRALRKAFRIEGAAVYLVDAKGAIRPIPVDADRVEDALREAQSRL